MTNSGCDVFELLLYKNFLVRTRRWILTVILEIIVPLVLFVNIWHIGGSVSKTGLQHEVHHQRITGLCKAKLFVIPNNPFTQEFADRMNYCLVAKMKKLVVHGLEDGPCHYTEAYSNRFDSEEDLFKVYRSFYPRKQDTWTGYTFTAAIIFTNKSADLFEKKLEYTIKMPVPLSKELYVETSNKSVDLVYERGYAAFQLCVDEEVIKMKKNDSNFKLKIDPQEMPNPIDVKPDVANEKLKQVFCLVAVIAFLIPLCVETFFVANEKFLGISMLMSLNNVPYYMNLLSWLTSGLIISLIYTVPIVVLLNSHSTRDVLPFLQYGNPLILWIMFTLNVAHLITFGMHTSTYFTRPSFAIAGVIILYVSSTILFKFGTEENTFRAIPFFGIIFPNILLFRVCEEFNNYERMERIIKGVNWSNMFEVGDDGYGLQGSIGILLVFSILGTIFHFIMANYIHAINPGKYGIRKSPFCFSKFFKNMMKSADYDKVENIEYHTTNDKMFEPIPEDCATVIQIRKLTKSYRIGTLNRMKKCALRDISLDFLEKQTTILFGYNGSGKTTLLSIFAGSTNPSEGLVVISGKNVRSQSDEITRELGFCLQENVLFPDLSVSEQLSFFNTLKNPNKSNSVIDVEVNSLLEKLKLSNKSRALPRHLSYAERRKVCLGQALIGNPKIIILDEPTVGLDAENKRHIWNLLLKMNGQKTILISTRDVEEANVLSDRVAMLHEGELKCYGTPSYFKNLLGQGTLQVTLTTDLQCEAETICDYFDPETEVIKIAPGKIVLSVPDNNDLPDSLDKIEHHKKELSIIRINVSNDSLEKVYQEATHDDSAPLASREPSYGMIGNLDSEKLSKSILKALIYKKAIYTMNNQATILIFLTMLFASLVCAFLVLISEPTRRVEIPIKLDMYGNVTAYYIYHNATAHFAENYKKVVEERHGKVVDLELNPVYFDIGLRSVASQDAFDYAYHSFIAAEFQRSTNVRNKVKAKAMYNAYRSRFAMPISINLVSNAVLKSVVGKDHSIETSYGELPLFKDDVEIDNLTTSALTNGYVVAGIVAFFLFTATAFFVVHPARESLSNVKHLQRMAGVSGVAYWGIMFAFDFLIFLVVSVIFVVKYVMADIFFTLNMFGWKEAFILLMLFLLFVANALPIVYSFSFGKKSTSTKIAFLILLPLSLVIVVVSIYIVKLHSLQANELFDKFRIIQKGAFLLIPHVSFFYGITSFFSNLRINSECRKLTNLDNDRMCELTPCCSMKCVDGACSNAVSYFNNIEDDVTLETCIIAMCVTPILYFSILFILEYKLIAKMLAKIRPKVPENSDETFEEQVKKVKHQIAFEASKVRENVSNGSNTNGNLNVVENGIEIASLIGYERKHYEFFVFELKKWYGNVVAVDDVSFGVQRNECFGILGAGGAGKSTILKIITGQEIPSYGMTHLRGVHYLKGMGYCPQSDALIKSLNAYDHLRLFARLRGIPEKKVDREVTVWVEKLNLNDCASQPCETYSDGNKKRLNIAMALIGHPKLVLLDEPTKNLDPSTKRALWQIIQSCQTTGQTILLTSDSMEECLTLCQSFAIMADSKFAYIGSSEELKQRFGTGYDVQLKLNRETSTIEIDALKKNISEALPCEIVNENSESLKFHVLPVDITWRKMYDLLFDMQEKYCCIQEFSVLTSSLEQVFSVFIKPVHKVTSQK